MEAGTRSLTLLAAQAMIDELLGAGVQPDKASQPAPLLNTPAIAATPDDTSNVKNNLQNTPALPSTQDSDVKDLLHDIRHLTSTVQHEREASSTTLTMPEHTTLLSSFVNATHPPKRTAPAPPVPSALVDVRPTNRNDLYDIRSHIPSAYDTLQAEMEAQQSAEEFRKTAMAVMAAMQDVIAREQQTAIASSVRSVDRVAARALETGVVISKPSQQVDKDNVSRYLLPASKPDDVPAPHVAAASIRDKVLHAFDTLYASKPAFVVFKEDGCTPAATLKECEMAAPQASIQTPSSERTEAEAKTSTPPAPVENATKDEKEQGQTRFAGIYEHLLVAPSEKSDESSKLTKTAAEPPVDKKSNPSDAVLMMQEMLDKLSKLVQTKQESKKPRGVVGATKQQQNRNNVHVSRKGGSPGPKPNNTAKPRTTPSGTVQHAHDTHTVPPKPSVRKSAAVSPARKAVKAAGEPVSLLPAPMRTNVKLSDVGKAADLLKSKAPKVTSRVEYNKIAPPKVINTRAAAVKPVLMSPVSSFAMETQSDDGTVRVISDVDDLDGFMNDTLTPQPRQQALPTASSVSSLSSPAMPISPSKVTSHSLYFSDSSPKKETPPQNTTRDSITITLATPSSTPEASRTGPPTSPSLPAPPSPPPVPTAVTTLMRERFSSAKLTAGNKKPQTPAAVTSPPAVRKTYSSLKIVKQSSPQHQLETIEEDVLLSPVIVLNARSDRTAHITPSPPRPSSVSPMKSRPYSSATSFVRDAAALYPHLAVRGPVVAPKVDPATTAAKPQALIPLLPSPPRPASDATSPLILSESPQTRVARKTLASFEQKAMLDRTDSYVHDVQLAQKLGVSVEDYRAMLPHQRLLAVVKGDHTGDATDVSTSLSLSFEVYSRSRNAPQAAVDAQQRSDMVLNM